MSGNMFNFEFRGDPFMGIQPGDTVAYMAHVGTGSNGPEYKPANGRCRLVFPTHAMLVIGGKHGIPVVVDEKNFIRIARKGRGSNG